MTAPVRFLDATLRAITPVGALRALIWTLISFPIVWLLGLGDLVVYTLLFGFGLGGQLLVSAGINPRDTPKAFAVAFIVLVIVMSSVWLALGGDTPTTLTS